MKKDIHPNYVETTISCACGSVIHTRATKENIKVELCSQCHPFYTGKQKLVDTAGRVERFQRKYAAKLQPQPKAQPQAQPQAQRQEQPVAQLQEQPAVQPQEQPTEPPQL